MMPEDYIQPPSPAAQDGLIAGNELAVRLPIFEGPLDLLLFLIRRNELDIYDIPMETVTRQYLDTLHAMETLDLEVAGEFFVMASTLMYIKSRMLLPTHQQLAAEDEEEEEADPRWELIQQLLEYKRFKDAADELHDLSERARDLIPRHYRPADEEQPERPLQPTDRIELWNTFNRVLRQLAEKIVSGEIHEEQVTIAARMETVLNRLRNERRFLFSSLFEEHRTTIPVLVATFLALLELARLNQVSLAQTEDFGDITCSRPDSAALQEQPATPDTAGVVEEAPGNPPPV